MRLRWCVWLISLAATILLSGCGGGGPVLPEVAPNHLVLGTPETLARSITVSGAGGTVTVLKTGHALHTMALVVPEGAFPGGASFTITATPIAGHTFGTLLRPLTPLIGIDDGGQSVDVGVMRLTIPLANPTEEQVLAFSYNRQTGMVEPLSTLAVTNAALTVALTQCTSPVQLKATVTDTAGIELFIAAVDAAQLPDALTTGFRPGVDSWQFPNRGSYVTPGGQCVGWSTTALYDFLARKNGVPLYGRYDNGDGPGWTTPGFWQDDTRAYRLTAAAQRMEDGRWATYLQALPSAAGAELDRLNLLACRCALYFTGEPQLLVLADPSGLGHMVVVYRADAGMLWLADPVYPAGADRVIAVGAAGFGSYDNYTEMHFLSRSTMIDWSRIRDLWQAFDQGIAGIDLFPRNRLEWLNDDGRWEEVIGAVTTTQAQIELRAAVENVDVPGWRAYTRETQALDATPVTGSRVYPLTATDTTLGINILAKPTNQPNWEWVNFQWITFHRE